MEIEIVNCMKAELIGYYGSDKRISERAWVSTNRAEGRTSEDVATMVKTLIKRGHTKPLETVVFSFRVEIPINIDRQLSTHRMVTASIANSARYTQQAPRFYINDTDPQGYGKRTDLQILYDSYCLAIRTYQTDTNLSAGRARELARDMLPVCMVITREFDINLLSLCNFMRLRLNKHAQYEMQQLAWLMLQEIKQKCPDLVTAITALEEAEWKI